MRKSFTEVIERAVEALSSPAFLWKSFLFHDLGNEFRARLSSPSDSFPSFVSSEALLPCGFPFCGWQSFFALSESL
jgi:hypothetical protein